MLQSATFGTVKGLTHPDGVFLWDAYYADHSTADGHLGIDLIAGYADETVAPFIITHEFDGVISIDDLSVIPRLPFLSKYQIITAEEI
jgi:hypothetical protein